MDELLLRPRPAHMLSAREHDEHVRVPGVGRTHGLDRRGRIGSGQVESARSPRPECKVITIHINLAKLRIRFHRVQCKVITIQRLYSYASLFTGYSANDSLFVRLSKQTPRVKETQRVHYGSNKLVAVRWQMEFLISSCGTAKN
jgi:hypothetical protein